MQDTEKQRLWIPASLWKNAWLSVLYATLVTAAILIVWLSVTSEIGLTWTIVGIILLFAAYTITRWLAYGIFDVPLTSRASQWAPIAAASMIVGWTAATAKANNMEELRINWAINLIGVLFSLWCIIVAVDGEERFKKSLVCMLTFTNILVPGIIGIAAAFIFYR